MHAHTVTAATALLAASLTLTACSSSSRHPSAHTSPPPTSQVTVTTQTPTLSPPETTTAAPPATPEEKLNKIAEDHGWTLDDANASDDDGADPFGDTPLYDSPAAFVPDICDSLPDQADSGPAQWLAQDQATTPDEMHILGAGIPLLCPEWTKAVRQAASGRYPVFFSSGTFKVTSRRANDTVPPGTYRTTGELSGCYWERAKADGTIIANNFATAATQITVSIRSSDDLFTSQDCGTWKPVR
jgi:hypothetical protein